MVEKEFNRRDFLNAGMLGLGTLIFPRALNQENSLDDLDYVVQTGDRVFEINGRKYEITVNEEAVVILSLLMAELRGGEELRQKTEEWFVSNKLEMTLRDKEHILAVKGAFNHWPDDMKQMTFYKPLFTDSFNYFKNEDSEPPLTIPHELTHLTDYIKDPKRYELMHIGHLISGVVGVGIIGGLGYLASKEERYPKLLRSVIPATLLMGGISVADRAYRNYLHRDFYESSEEEWNRNQEMRGLTEMVLDFKEV